LKPDFRMILFTKVLGVDVVSSWDKPSMDKLRYDFHVGGRWDENWNPTRIGYRLSIVPVELKLAPGSGFLGIVVTVDSDSNNGFHRVRFV
jgi:hypothetical protein